MSDEARDCRDFLIRHLRSVLEAPGTSGRVLAAKAAAARQLAALEGLAVAGARQEHEAAARRVDGVDPMGDLDDLELQRRKRAQAAS